MKQFYLRIIFITSIYLSGYFCPAFAQTQNNGDDSENDGSSPGLFSPSASDQQLVSDPLNDGTALFSAGPPPGTGGNPIGGETPVGPGLSFLIGLSLFYLFYLAMFNFIKKKKMNKSIITLFILLAVSTTQAFGQPGVSVPNGATRIYLQDFGGNLKTDPLISPKPLEVVAPGATTSLIFQNSTTNLGPANQGSVGAYTIVKNLMGRNTAAYENVYPVWWGNTTQGPVAAQAAVTEALAVCDHTSQDNPVPGGSALTGYMMVINASSDPNEFFRYTINGLCPNTRLYVSFWAINLLKNKNSSQNDPNISAQIQSGSDTLARYDNIIPTYYPGTGAAGSPPVTYSSLAEVPNYGWTKYVLEFQNTDLTSVDIVLINNLTGPTATNGNDLAIDDIEVFKITPDVTPASISSPNFYYCAGSPMDMAASYVDSTGVFENKANFAWLYSAKGDFTDSLVVSKDSICRWPAQEGAYKVVIGAQGNLTFPDPTHVKYNECSSVSPAVTVHMIPPSTVLYWNGSENEDWNDYRNWTDDGAPSLFAPNSCVDVEIPGNKTVFPSLDFTATKDSFACNNIRFHYGGLIGQPQQLLYKKAFVQYNFGNSSDPYSATAMDRDSRWYALAAPLQKMASGDFGFCGYPTVWQERFSSTDQSLAGGYESLGKGVYGAWYVPENINSWDLSTQYNAITLWVQQDSPNLTTGMDATSRALKGILEVPFYQNAIDSVYHRGTYRDDDNNTSYFQYYYSDQPQLGYPLIDPAVKTPGYIDRGSNNEAYRFIFDGPSFDSTTKGIYTMTIPSPAAAATGMVMIGNPFMSDLDFANFADDNSKDFDGYYIYNGSTFDAYSPTTSSDRYIAPLQAFFITPTVTTLTFNANTEAVVAPPADIPALRSSAPDSGAKADVMFITASNTKGSSRVTLSLQDLNAKNLPLLLMKGYDSIPGIYAVDAAGQRNAIQFEGGYVDSIPLGVYSSDSVDPITLTVSEKDKLSVSYLQLVDKYLNTTTDLMKTDIYAYTNVPNTPDRFLLLMKYNQTTTGISTPVSTRPVAVSVSNNTLYVSSGVSIEDVSVITLQGITVAKDSNIGKPTYAKSLELPAGLYLVSVKVKTGQTSVAKVVVR